MTPEAWARVKVIFAAALEHPAGERGRHLDLACGGDAELRAEVESLLDAHTAAGSFLATEPQAKAEGGAPGIRAGGRVGPWELIAPLGEGGMGIVYRARRADGQFAMDVAVKLIRRGFGGEDVMRRFLAERQILARLLHAGIARLLDGGTTEDGHPYLVMELIDGQPIDVWCDERRLPLPARLELFCTVCAAVQAAHGHLIVHRDIKPSNLLVNAAGEPKLLDFGIAKLLDAPGDTAQAARVMTPQYASPEQVRGDLVTTATDVHALGLLLYVLVTGRHPFEARTTLDAAWLVLHEEPARPSSVVRDPAAAAARGLRPESLRRALSGDLDAVVLRALRKEPAERYQAADHLAEDVRRHLQRLPVVARRGALSYRAGRFVRRNGLALAATAAIFAALLGGIVLTARQADIARHERALAERRFQDVRRLADAMLFELHDAIADLPGATAARELLVKRALGYLDALAAEGPPEGSLALDVAAGYRKLGDVQGNPSNNNLGQAAGARRSYRKALDIVSAVSGDPAWQQAARHERARLLDHLGDLSWQEGDLAAALASAREALELVRGLAAEAPDDATLVAELVSLESDIGDALVRTGDRPAALATYREALATERKLEATDPGARRLLSVLWNKLGDTLFAGGDSAGAMAGYLAALALRQALVAANATSAQALRDYSTSLSKVANVLKRSGDLAGAIAGYRRALAMDEAYVELDPKNARARRDIAMSILMIAQAEDKLAAGKGPDEQRALWQSERAGFVRALAILRELEASGRALPQDSTLPGAILANLELTDNALAKLAAAK